MANLNRFSFSVFSGESSAMDITDSAQGGAEIAYKVNWADRIPFMAELLGIPSESNTPPYTGQLRPPHRHPDLNALICNGCQSKAHGMVMAPNPPDPNNRFPAWEFAKIIASYGPQPFTVLPGAGDAALPPPEPDFPFPVFVEESRDVSAEALFILPENFKWLTGTEEEKIIQQNIPLLFPTVEFKILLHNVTFVDWPVLEAVAGKVNKKKFATRGIHTTLFMGASVRRSKTVLGFSPMDLVLSFKAKLTKQLDDQGNEVEVGWNHLFRQKTGKWEETEPLLYKDSDFVTDFNNNTIQINT